ncbi:proteinase-activated receptor 4 [Alligator mississippiensis]|uniref:Proteinase-activated receptor 4 n=1 Tax=Alligator mississippiensis TaxID=8496 RepID=A0A151NYL1_ALLMI|nr:proteinase-activated receptor 4 [Alligator mississippiensis]KYO41874.1 proteinase-activated receptor 4 [Alligator mississippiensis]
MCRHRRMSHQLVLWCSLWALCSAGPDYDDYSQNSTDEQRTMSQNTLCPRAIPGEKVTSDNTTYLDIHEAARSQLSSPVTVWLLPSLYTVVFLVGLPANGLALWVLATRIEKLTSTIFLMNLAAADLLLVLVLPFKLSYYFLGNHWPFGEGLCRLTTAFFYGNMYCSVLLLMCVSVDRYLGVVHPFFSRSFRSPGFAACTCAAVWVCAAIFTLPLTLLKQSYPLYRTNIILCHDALPRHEETEYYFYYFVCLIACGFLVPLAVMLFSYGSVLWALLGSGERYLHAMKLTALVLLTLVVFYTPSNILLLIHYSRSCSVLHGHLYISYMLSLALSACNSCIDPFIYYYVSEEFRDKVKSRLFGCSKQTITSLKTSKEMLPQQSSHSQSVV